MTEQEKALLGWVWVTAHAQTEMYGECIKAGIDVSAVLDVTDYIEIIRIVAGDVDDACIEDLAELLDYCESREEYIDQAEKIIEEASA